MLSRMHHIGIEVSAMAQSVKFYTEMLGFTKMSEYYFEERGRRIVFLQLGDIAIELLSGPQNTPYVEAPPPQCGYKHVALLADNVDAEVERLRALGVTVRAEPFNTAVNSRIAFIEDPDGIPIELWQDL